MAHRYYCTYVKSTSWMVIWRPQAELILITAQCWLVYGIFLQSHCDKAELVILRHAQINLLFLFLCAVSSLPTSRDSPVWRLSAQLRNWSWPWMSCLQDSTNWLQWVKLSGCRVKRLTWCRIQIYWTCCWISLIFSPSAHCFRGLTCAQPMFA